jgi:hypothetical protein
LRRANPEPSPIAARHIDPSSSIFVGRDQRLAAFLDHRFRNLAGKFVAPHAVQFLAEPTCTPLTGSDPGPFPPGRIIADVLPVSALKLGDPVTISVDMVANDLSLHLNITTVEGEGAERAK